MARRKTLTLGQAPPQPAPPAQVPPTPAQIATPLAMAAHVKISGKTLYRLMKDGTLPQKSYFRVGGQIRFIVPEVFQALRNNRGARRRSSAHKKGKSSGAR